MQRSFQRCDISYLRMRRFESCGCRLFLFCFSPFLFLFLHCCFPCPISMVVVELSLSYFTFCFFTYCSCSCFFIDPVRMSRYVINHVTTDKINRKNHSTKSSQKNIQIKHTLHLHTQWPQTITTARIRLCPTTLPCSDPPSTAQCEPWTARFSTGPFCSRRQRYTRHRILRVCVGSC